MRKVGLKTREPQPTHLPDQNPEFQVWVLEWGSHGPSVRAGRHKQLRSISVITTYTLCHFLVEQAQALGQWDSGGPAWPRDGTHSPPSPPGILIPPFLREPGELLEGHGEEQVLNLRERHWLRKKLDSLFSTFQN